MSPPSRRFQSIETNVIHAGDEEHIAGAVVRPVFQSANYLMAGEGTEDALRYIRLNNSPNHTLLHRRLAIIESCESALVTSSGMAAITAVLLGFLRSGDHILTHRTLYGGTQGFLDEDAPGLQISHSPIDMTEPSEWEASLRRNTRMIYVESISNPLMEVGDLEAIVAFARRHGLLAVIDNTFATPVNFRPHEIGFDLVVHSATKYLNGHSDIVAGVVAGSEEHVQQVRHTLNHLGGSLDPHACFLLERGMKTLVVRLERQNASALRLARFLSEQAAVRRVQYPGLEGDPNHRRARSLFSGFGGMLSFYLRRPEDAERCIQRLRIPLHAPSLGGVESLVVRPAFSSHRGLPAEARQQLGLTDDLIRVSLGLESIDELLDDFGQALSF